MSLPKHCDVGVLEFPGSSTLVQLAVALLAQHTTAGSAHANETKGKLYYRLVLAWRLVSLTDV